MVKKTTALLLAASLLLSACGSKEENHHQPPKITAGDESTMNQSNETPNESQNTVEAPNKDPNPNEATTTDPTDKNEAETDKNQTKPKEQSPVQPQYHMNKIYNIVPNDEVTEKKVVLLTFDDGPKDKTMINNLIDTLDKHDAKAIFFVNGYRVKQNPELLKLIHDRGQIIGNHSWDHIDLRKQNFQETKKQIEDVQKIVMKTIGEKPKFFRPPFGSGGDDVKNIARDNNLLFMTWSNGSLDWESKSKNNPDAVINNVMEQLHPGSNILMHELPWTVEALDTLLTKLEKKGYSFVDPRNIEPKMR
ncbi:Peptidoglycan/xylan/chitin deacetylase, PgdA/CDA1 family [Paenibacillus uliginis N3/975]|uniref:Peptidoglycan/xylan/chitin deacetylase, PgdA/CDA1 family n=1 Tax=Paenibacillus uliginis N3/975 TaxID=1313296 RepID=A0A1X7HIW7_9BACL|nr:polysaccharide deacetylase family protein [Paenibacillus uliginis]SMF87500.1 Peptidoglycan/xylan/chitin deacetylase, PgdA/CDA1 family [Paenibacillus uliginis N3/975]